MSNEGTTNLVSGGTTAVSPKPLNALEFERQFPQIRQRIVHAGKVQVDELIRVEGVEAEGTASFALGSVLGFTAGATFAPPHQSKPFFGQVYVGLYEGTVLTTAKQIYPWLGTAIPSTRYVVQAGYDEGGWDGIGGFYTGAITNSAGTSGTVISFLTQWQYLDYTLGTIVSEVYIGTRTT